MLVSVENNLPLCHTIYFPEKVDINGNMLFCEIWGQIPDNGSFTWIAETTNSPYIINYSEAMINKKVNYRLCYKSEDANNKFADIKNVLIR
jgi:hypothetical protein